MLYEKCMLRYEVANIIQQNAEYGLLCDVVRCVLLCERLNVMQYRILAIFVGDLNYPVYIKSITRIRVELRVF